MTSVPKLSCKICPTPTRHQMNANCDCGDSAHGDACSFSRYLLPALGPAPGLRVAPMTSVYDWIISNSAGHM